MNFEQTMVRVDPQEAAANETKDRIEAAIQSLTAATVLDHGKGAAYFLGMGEYFFECLEVLKITVRLEKLCKAVFLKQGQASDILDLPSDSGLHLQYHHKMMRLVVIDAGRKDGDGTTLIDWANGVCRPGPWFALFHADLEESEDKYMNEFVGPIVPFVHGAK